MEKSITNINTTDSAKGPKYYLALGILVGLTIGLVIILTSSYFPMVTVKKFHDPKFRLASISQSPFSISNSFPHASIIYNDLDNWNLTFLVKNPSNGYIFSYEDLKAKITYSDSLLWQTNVSANFYQEEKSHAFIDASFDTMHVAYTDWVANSIASDLVAGRPIKFEVVLNAKVQISHHDEARCGLSCGKLQVSCDGLEVEFLRDAKVGTLAISSNVCKVLLEKSSC